MSYNKSIKVAHYRYGGYVFDTNQTRRLKRTSELCL
jgi:hypothetical protein